jgi:hypothetical protein
MIVVVNAVQIAEFRQSGYTIVRELFSPDECSHYATYFTDMVERGGDGWAEGEVDPAHPDPLRRYPRLLQPHRGDRVAFDFMVDPRVREHLTGFAGAEPFAVQTMVYFKAPGARGQNLHQDNMYLQVQPGTCLAAWLALDDCDEENGCMVLVPNSGGLPILCQVAREGLDAEQWNNVETPLQPGMETVPALMKRGDVLFFNGNVIHGSYRNRSSDRFRRTLIGHYIAAEAKEVAKYYFPVYRMDGRELTDGVESAGPGGPCGVFVGEEIQMTGRHQSWESAH